MVKFCKFDRSKVCYHNCCSVFNPIFGVSVCPLFRGGNFFKARKVGVGCRDLVSKHLRRKGSGTFG